jgi:SAM-dependent methyltransferase
VAPEAEADVPVLVPAVPVPVLAPVAAVNQAMARNHSNTYSDPFEKEYRTSEAGESPALPRKELLTLQSTWLAPARSRMLRRIAITGKHHILDIGAGYGQGSVELARRSSGMVVAFDLSELSLREAERQHEIVRIAGNATQLPFTSDSFDLVLSQFALLWIKPLQEVLEEIGRVLEPAGVLVALEPDYEAMIEYPPEIAVREIWLEALVRSGAEPRIGRKLPGLLSALGFSVKVNLLEQIQQSTPRRFEFLDGLPLTEAERVQLRAIRELATSSTYGGWQQISHLPFFLITAVNPGSKPY